MIQLRTDTKFRAALRRHTASERAHLKNSIKKYGYAPEHPVVVWESKQIVVDGHERLEVCKELGIDPSVVNQEFDSDEAVLEWIGDMHDARRHFTKEEKDERRKAAAREYLERVEASKKAGKNISVPDQKAVKNSTPGADGHVTIENKTTAEQVGKKHGFSEKTVRRAAILEEVRDAIQEDQGAIAAVESLSQKQVLAAHAIAKKSTDSDGGYTKELCKRLTTLAPKREAKSVVFEGQAMVTREKVEVPDEINSNGCQLLIELVKDGVVTVKMALAFIEQVPRLEHQAQIAGKGKDAVAKASQGPKDQTSSLAAKLASPLTQSDLDEITERLVNNDPKTIARLVDYALMLCQDEPMTRKVSKAIVRRIKASRDTVKVTLVTDLLNHEPSDNMLKKMKAWGRKTFGANETAMLKPTVEEVKEYAHDLKRQKKYDIASQVAEEFWHECESKGWEYGTRGKMKPIKNWKSRFCQYIGWKKRDGVTADAGPRGFPAPR